MDNPLGRPGAYRLPSASLDEVGDRPRELGKCVGAVLAKSRGRTSSPRFTVVREDLLGEDTKGRERFFPYFLPLLVESSARKFAGRTPGVGDEFLPLFFVDHRRLVALHGPLPAGYRYPTGWRGLRRTDRPALGVGCLKWSP